MYVYIYENKSNYKSIATTCEQIRKNKHPGWPQPYF